MEIIGNSLTGNLFHLIEEFSRFEISPELPFQDRKFNFRQCLSIVTDDRNTYLGRSWSHIYLIHSRSDRPGIGAPGVGVADVGKILNLEDARGFLQRAPFASAADETGDEA